LTSLNRNEETQTLRNLRIYDKARNEVDGYVFACKDEERLGEEFKVIAMVV